MPELTIGVSLEFRRIGIGERLMEELYKAASVMNLPLISVGVHKDNLLVMNRYKKQEWVEDGRVKEYVIMSRKQIFHFKTPKYNLTFAASLKCCK